MDSSFKRDDNLRWLFLLIFAVGAALRFYLYYASPPANAFDDHFTPVFLTMKEGFFPALDACWECHQPPFFYYIQALFGGLTSLLGADFTGPAQLKLLQLVPALYGVATLYFVYLILKRLQFSTLAKVSAFAIICFLPRHIYMSAMHTNDTLAILLVTVSIYLFMRALSDGFTTRRVIFLSIVMTAAIFTKYLTLALLPAVGVGFIVTVLRGGSNERGEILKKLVIVMIIPMVLFGAKLAHNKANYDTFLPVNFDLMKKERTQRPGEGRVSYASFAPASLVSAPVMTPENINSLWTVIYARLWFDAEPRFMTLLNEDQSYKDNWNRYYTYFDKSGSDWPGLGFIPTLPLRLGSGIILLSFIISIIIAIGFFRAVSNIFSRAGPEELKQLAPASALFAILFIMNILGIIKITLSLPYFSVFKGVFLLYSLPSFAFFAALAVSGFDENRSLKTATIIVTAAISLLSIIHILILGSNTFYWGIFNG